MSVSCMTFINWLHKGSVFTSKLIDALKNQVDDQYLLECIGKLYGLEEHILIMGAFC